MSTCHPPTEPVQPGRRDYVWTVDTLTVPYGDTFYPSRIWGSAADDVWLVGTGMTMRLIWHFNGTEWQTDSTFRSIHPSSLWGFSSDDIWLGNLGNVFWHYNGYAWSKYSEVTPPEGYDITSIEGLWGSNPASVWGVGFATNLTTTNSRGIIMHFDGLQWNFKPIPSLPVAFIKIRKQRSSQQLFVQGQRTAHVPRDTFKIYTYDGSESLHEIYSSTKVMTLAQINGEVYFISQRKIYTYHHNEFILWKDFSTTNFIAGIFGRSEKDFFGYTTNSDYSIYGIGHYNGMDFQEIYTLPRWLRISGMVIFERDIFFQCYSLKSNMNIVVHGKLPDK